MSTIDNVKSAIEAGERIARSERDIHEVAGIPVALIPNGYTLTPLKQVLDIADARAAAPRHLSGMSTHQTAQSLIDHALRFKKAESVLWANRAERSVTAIYDYSVRELPAWGRHTASYRAELSDAWYTWTAASGKPLTQTDLGDLLEVNFSDLATGVDGTKPADVLEMARDLRIHSKGQFERKMDPVSGQYSLVSKLEHASTSTKILRAFWLGIPVFVEGAAYQVECRVRFWLQEGTPRFEYSIHRASEYINDAFRDVWGRIASETGLHVFHGCP